MLNQKQKVLLSKTVCWNGNDGWSEMPLKREKVTAQLPFSFHFPFSVRKWKYLTTRNDRYYTYAIPVSSKQQLSLKKKTLNDKTHTHTQSKLKGRFYSRDLREAVRTRVQDLINEFEVIQITSLNALLMWSSSSNPKPVRPSEWIEELLRKRNMKAKAEGQPEVGFCSLKEKAFLLNRSLPV